jgi:hypothetical protein
MAHRHMNVEIGTETALFPEKEYISGIFLAVHCVQCSYINSIIPHIVVEGGPVSMGLRLATGLHFSLLDGHQDFWTSLVHL